MESRCNRHHKQALSTRNFGYALHSTECLFVMPIAPTSHHNFLSILAFLETFIMVLINRKQVLKQSEDFFSHLQYIQVKFETACSFCLQTQRKSETSFYIVIFLKICKNFLNQGHPNVLYMVKDQFYPDGFINQIFLYEKPKLAIYVQVFTSMALISQSLSNLGSIYTLGFLFKPFAIFIIFLPLSSHIDFILNGVLQLM